MNAEESLNELKGLEARYAMSTYRRFPVEFVRGQGSRLWDADGNEYIDFFTGLAVHNLGHSHPAIVAAITEQAGRFMGSSNLYYSRPAMELSRALAESFEAGGGAEAKVFLCNSGTEASECAIKLVRKHAHRRGAGPPNIVSLSGGFHGRTVGALSATPKMAREDLFGALPAGFITVDRDDPEALRAAVDDRTAAIFIEPIQGEAGIFPISEEVILAAREAATEVGAALVFDEVQTGVGRTGSMWAFEQLGVVPDVITSAKALGGGLPVGACVAGGEFAEVFEPGDHGSTFAGGPLGAAAALATLGEIDDDLLASVRENGAWLRDRLAGIDGVVEVRGSGMMVGVTLAEGIDAMAVVTELLHKGLVLNCPGPRMLRLLPALNIPREDLEAGTALIESTL